MESAKKFALYSLLVASLIIAVGCGTKADENKPLSEVKAEAEKMNNDELRASAMEYKKAIEAKKADVEKLADKLKDIPPAELLGEKAKSLNADMEKINQSVSALQDRFQIYCDKLKEKGGDVSGL